MNSYAAANTFAQVRMNDYDFQRQVRALKERISKISMRYSPNRSRENMFSNQLHALNSQVDAMQQRLMVHERPSPRMPFQTIPEALLVNSNSPYEAQSHLSLPSGPLFWQLFENLRTDLRSIDSRVATLESSVSDLEDRVDALDPDRFTPPSSASGTDLNDFLNARTTMSYFGDVESRDKVLELSSESSCPVATHQTSPHGAGEYAEPLSMHQQTGFAHAQQNPHAIPQSCRDPRLTELLDLRNATSYELIKMQENNVILMNTIQRLISQVERAPNTPSSGNAGKKADPPKENHLLPYFQKLEDTLECFCGVDAIKLNGYETMRTTGLTLSETDILRSTQWLLAYFASEALHEAVSNGRKDEHFEDMLAVARDADALGSVTCMDDPSARTQDLLRSKVKCEVHGVIECIRCRKERKRMNVETAIKGIEKAVGRAKLENNYPSNGLPFHIQQSKLDGTAEPKRAFEAVTHGQPLEGLAFRDKEISRLDEQLRIAQERLRASEESLNDERVLLLQTRQERDDLKQSNSDLTARIYEFEEDAYDYNSRLLAKERQLGDLHNLIEQKDRALEVWERSWTQLHESSERENAKSRDRERLVAEERERNEYTMERAIDSHHKEMKSIQEFCEQKDGVICKQEQIISRGRKLLEEREREIELLQHDLRAMRDDKEHAMRNEERTARLLQERTADLADLKRYYEPKEKERVRTSSNKDEKYMDAVEQQDTTNARDSRFPAVTFSNRETQMPDRVRIDSERFGNTTGYQSDRGHGRRRKGPERHRRSRQDESAEGWSTPRVYKVQGGETSTARPSQTGPLDVTFQPPLPAPVRVRRAESEANLRNASRNIENTNADPAHKSLSKYQSMHEMRGSLQPSLQPYVESDAGSGGELGGEV